MITAQRRDIADITFRTSFNSLRRLVWTIGFMPSCTTSWTSASPLFPVCHYWPNWLIQVCLIIVAMTTEVRHTWINQFGQ